MPPASSILVTIYVPERGSPDAIVTFDRALLPLSLPRRRLSTATSPDLDRLPNAVSAGRDLIAGNRGKEAERQQVIEDAARALDSALTSGVTIGQFSTRYPDMTIEDGYAIQSRWTRLRMQQGHKIVGRKIGLTSRAM